MKQSEFTGRWEVQIEPGGFFSCWVYIWPVDENGNRTRQGYSERAYRLTKMGARWWARKWIREQRPEYKERQARKERDRNHTYIVDTNAAKGEERGEGWLRRTFTK